MPDSHAEAMVAGLNAVDGALAKPTPRHEAKWDDPELTKTVAWAMGVHAAEAEFDARPIPASGKCIDRQAQQVDWWCGLRQRSHLDGLHVFLEARSSSILYQQFCNGWQSQRAELLAEHLGKHLGNAMSQFCVDDLKVERVLEAFVDEVKLDEWFVGAGE